MDWRTGFICDKICDDMEREIARSKHEAVVQPFLLAAFKEGAHRIKPKYPSQDVWSRQIMIGVVYNDKGSTATIEELGAKYGAFKQSISKSNKSFLINLWNNSSQELQERCRIYDLLDTRKPWSRRSKERRSLSEKQRTK